MKAVILLMFSLFILIGSIQGQRDTINYIDSPIRPPRRIRYSLYDFKNNLTVNLTNNEIIKKFGEPSKNIGSGLLIYVYELVDSTEVWIGSNGKKIIYAKHMNANHHIIDTLDLKPDPADSFCQLLNNPSLTVEDFEIALTNADHLRKILSAHNFESYTTGASELNSPGSMSNQLYPDLKILKSENWVLKDSQVDQSFFTINMFEWEPNHAPHPAVIKTIRILVRRDSKYADQMKAFLEEIKIKYPNESKRYFRNSEPYKSSGEPLIVFTNGSNIEVRTEAPDARYFNFYTVSFDLIK